MKEQAIRTTVDIPVSLYRKFARIVASETLFFAKRPCRIAMNGAPGGDERRGAGKKYHHNYRGPKGDGIARTHGVEIGAQETGESECQGNPQDKASRGQQETLGKNEPQKIRSASAERHSQPQLARALRDCVGHNPI